MLKKLPHLSSNGSFFFWFYSHVRHSSTHLRLRARLTSSMWLWECSMSKNRWKYRAQHLRTVCFFLNHYHHRRRHINGFTACYRIFLQISREFSVFVNVTKWICIQVFVLFFWKFHSKHSFHIENDIFF